MDAPEYYGDDQDEHLLASLSRITYHLKRQKNENARQFLAKWEAAERKVQEHRVNLPSIYKGFLLINALGLAESDIKALLNFTQGSIEPKDVKHWLRKHEAKLQANQLGNESLAKSSKTTTSTVHLVEGETDLNEDETIADKDDDDLEAMETMLADMVDNPLPESEVFEEQEAAEILAMMIREKKKTYTQSAQLKKDRELGRGYRQGSTGQNHRAATGPLRPGTYRLSIAELKQRTRCQKCGRIGHWKRECPGVTSNGQASNQKETHLLEVDVDDYDDAMFCHLLEIIPDDVNVSAPTSASGSILNQEAEPKGCGVGPAQRDSPISELDYMVCRLHELWYSESHMFEDAACATLDTGCQRTAVGRDTLENMKPHWPQDLQWFRQSEVNRFRSVHGVSQTSYNAVVPCSLGPKGCYLKPAVFDQGHSAKAPFLISLRFLIQGDAVISLVEGKLMLVLQKHGAKLPLCIGPTGALRIPLNNFTAKMHRCLKEAENRLQQSDKCEFEVLSLGELPSPPAGTVVRACSDSAAALGPQVRHGLLVADQQESAARTGRPGQDRSRPRSLAQPPAEGLRDLPPADPADGQLGGQLPRQVVPACQAQRQGVPSGTATRTQDDDRRGHPGQERRGPGAVQEVPKLAPGASPPREEDRHRVRFRDGGQGELVTGTDGVHFPVHPLERRDRKPRKTTFVGGFAEVERTSTGTATSETDVAEQAITVDQNLGGRIQQHLEQHSERRQGDGQDEAAGDLHLRGSAIRERSPAMQLRTSLQDGAQPDSGELQTAVLQLSERPRARTMRDVQVVRAPAAVGRRVPGDPGPDPEQPPGKAHPSGVSGADDPRPVRALGNDPVGIQCLCGSHEMPDMPQAAERRTEDDEDTQPDGNPQQRQQDHRGGRQLEPQHGLPGVSGMAKTTPWEPLSRHKNRQLRSSLARTHRQMSTAFELTQVAETELPESRADRLKGFSKGDKKDTRTWEQVLTCGLGLGKARSKGLWEPDRVGADLAILTVSADPAEFSRSLQHALESQPTCLVLVMPVLIAQTAERDQIERLALQAGRKASKVIRDVVYLQEDTASSKVDVSIDFPYRSRSGSMEVATTWEAAHRVLQRTCELSVRNVLSVLRSLLAARCHVSRDDVYERDLLQESREQTQRQQRYENYMTRPLSENEVHYQRRVRARMNEQGHARTPDQQEDEDQEAGDSELHPVPDPPEGEGEPQGLDQRAARPGDGDQDSGDSGLHPVPDPPEGEGQDLGAEEKALPGSRHRTLVQLVRRAHEGLGHPHRERFVRILKAAKASEDVIKIAQELKCSVCEKFLQTRPPRRAAPPREFGINEVIGMDTIWLPMVGQKRKKIALNIIDYSSHFQMIIPLKGRSPEAVWSAYRQWVRFFGPPKQIWADQGGEFKGSFRQRTAQEGTRMDPSSLESPFQRGLAERHGRTFKVLLEKTMADYNCASIAEWHELVDNAVMMKNRLASRGGYSPVQRVMGYLPRLPGGLLSEGHADAEAGKELRLGDGGIVRAMNMRKAAAKAFFEVDSDQALRNVIAGGPRPQQDYVVGQMVYFYRLGHSKKGDRPHQRWHGPARVIMTDMPSTVWLSYQGNLVKASPERIRSGSTEEKLSVTGWLDGLTKAKEEFEKEPKRGYIDLSKEPVPDYEETIEYEPDEEDLLPEPELPVNRDRRRIRQKTSLEELRARTPMAVEPEAALPEQRPPSEDLPEDMAAGIWEPIPSPPSPAGDDEVTPGQGILEDDETVEPPTKRTRTHLLELYYAKLETLFKTRQRKEIRLKELNQHDLECFLRATEKEIANNLETKAYEKIDAETSARIRQEKPDRIMESRYVRTAKPLEQGDVDKAQCEGTLLKGEHGGPCKAKVRHVMKGFSEEGAEDLESATPQVTREGVMFTAQVIASKRWQLGFLDFTQAFHSGDPIRRELYAEQPPEGVPGMKKGDLLRLLKTCYGLLDGPMAWFRHLKRLLIEELGYVQSLADPCIYFLHDPNTNGWDKLIGIISVATDDMLHGGGEVHQAKMQMLTERYKLGKFQYGSGRFTGKQFTPQEDGSIMVDQNHYVAEKVHKIPLTKARKTQRYSYCTEPEIALLRSLVGALAWLAKETRPDLCGRVSLLQQQFPKPRVRDMISANQLAIEAERFPVGIRISPIEIQRLRVSAVTDASWGNAEGAGSKEDSGKDFWVETSEHWIRKHVQARHTLFHPGMVDNGPDLHAIEARRITYLNQENQETRQEDQWNGNQVNLVAGPAWTGQTVFVKSQQGLNHTEISEKFLQNRRTSSQGGHLVIFHDQDLQYEPSAAVTISSWKSYKLKRKVVNTLSAECQALASGIGNVHWHRFLLLEAQGGEFTNQDWEKSLAKIPYLAVTDSKSLYDSLSKQTCPYSQIDDKRTAIDISIIKNELAHGGTVRWIDGRNMISDSLTKSTGSSFLRHVMSHGKWTLNELGFETIQTDLDSSKECLFLFDGLWQTWFQPKQSVADVIPARSVG